MGAGSMLAYLTMVVKKKKKSNPPSIILFNLGLPPNNPPTTFKEPEPPGIKKMGAPTPCLVAWYMF
jgi:hypothetical protein